MIDDLEMADEERRYNSVGYVESYDSNQLAILAPIQVHCMAKESYQVAWRMQKTYQCYTIVETSF